MNRVIFLLPILVLLSGCGQSGDLYLPDDLRAEQLENEISFKRKQQQSVEEETSILSNLLSDQLQQLSVLEEKETFLRASGKFEEAEKVSEEIEAINFRLEPLRQKQKSMTAFSKKIDKLVQEASQRRQRHHELGALRTKLAQLEQREEALREGGESSEADEILKEINRTRHRLGTLILEQQRSR